MEVLAKAALLLTVTGLGGMIFLSSFVDLELTAIEDITPNDVGRSVKVCGEVEDKFTSRKGHTFFSLKGLRVVVFNSTEVPDLAWTEVCVVGRVEMYQGDLEIIAEEVSDV